MANYSIPCKGPLVNVFCLQFCCIYGTAYKSEHSDETLNKDYGLYSSKIVNPGKM